jgi:hypothetical protein
LIFFGVEGEEFFPEEFGYFDLANLLGSFRHLNCDFFRFRHHVVEELDDEEERGEECFSGVFGEAVDRLAVESFPDGSPDKLDVFDDVH